MFNVVVVGGGGAKLESDTFLIRSVSAFAALQLDLIIIYNQVCSREKYCYYLPAGTCLWPLSHWLPLEPKSFRTNRNDNLTHYMKIVNNSGFVIFIIFYCACDGHSY